MRHLLLLAPCLLCATGAHAFDATTQGLVVSGYVTSKVTTAPFDRKLLIHARDDAAMFVASEGRERGVRLEAALDALRHHIPHLAASDLELAQSILVQ